MTSTKKFLATGFVFIMFFSFLWLFAPRFAFANPSGANTGAAYECAPTPDVDSNGNPVYDSTGKQIMLYGNCGFNDLIAAVENVVNYAVTIALAFSVVVLAVAGWKYMTSGGDPTKISKAHKMFGKVLWGIFWVLAAWLIVNLVVTTLVNTVDVNSGVPGVPNLLK